MIKTSINTPSKGVLMRAFQAEVEKRITQTAQKAAAGHGGVRSRVTRKSDGSLRSVEFSGSEAAKQAAAAAVAG